MLSDLLSEIQFIRCRKTEFHISQNFILSETDSRGKPGCRFFFNPRARARGPSYRSRVNEIHKKSLKTNDFVGSQRPHRARITRAVPTRAHGSAIGRAARRVRGSAASERPLPRRAPARDRGAYITRPLWGRYHRARDAGRDPPQAGHDLQRVSQDDAGRLPELDPRRTPQHGRSRRGTQPKRGAAAPGTTPPGIHRRPATIRSTSARAAPAACRSWCPS